MLLISFISVRLQSSGAHCRFRKSFQRARVTHAFSPTRCLSLSKTNSVDGETAGERVGWAGVEDHYDVLCTGRGVGWNGECSDHLALHGI